MKAQEIVDRGITVLKNADESHSEVKPQEKGDVEDVTTFRVASATKTPRQRTRSSLNNSYT